MQWVYRYSGWLSVTWTVVIFILCATPGQYIPSASWMEMLSVDKLVHASIFFILTGLFLMSLVKSGKANHLNISAAVLAAVIYGLMLEIMQAKYFSNRSSDWHDVIANSTGCFVALAFIGKIRKLSASSPLI